MVILCISSPRSCLSLPDSLSLARPWYSLCQCRQHCHQRRRRALLCPHALFGVHGYALRLDGCLVGRSVGLVRQEQYTNKNKKSGLSICSRSRLPFKLATWCVHLILFSPASSLDTQAALHSRWAPSFLLTQLQQNILCDFSASTTI